MLLAIYYDSIDFQAGGFESKSDGVRRRASDRLSLPNPDSISISFNICKRNPYLRYLQVSRLFSNLVFKGDALQHQPGSILGCTALISGTTVGAGILALPAVTVSAGILPSSVLLIAVWFYALIVGLLLVEVNLKTLCTLGKTSSGLLGMIECSLGKSWVKVASLNYLFLHYALLVAYLARGGEILGSPLQLFVGNNLAQYLGIFVFLGVFGGLIYLGSDRLIHQFNNVFVAIVLVSLITLLYLGIERIDPGNFNYRHWEALTPAVPIVLVALFYHNVIPVVTSQLEGDYRKISFCLVTGSLVPLVMFLAWNGVILGGVTPEVMTSIKSSEIAFDPIAFLEEGRGGKWLGIIVSIFSEFAIVTSFIGFVYGLRDFYTDVWQTEHTEAIARWKIYGLILIPPAILAVLNPTIFLKALDYAGSFSISVIGGIIPVLMVWQQRYNVEKQERSLILVPGGKLMLISLTILSLGIIVQEFI